MRWARCSTWISASDVVIEGRYFDGRSSASQPAQLLIGIDRLVRVVGVPQGREVPLASVQISDRLGRTPRRITFDDGAVFETLDNDAVDAALAPLVQRTLGSQVDLWERHWPEAIIALVAIAVLAVLFVRNGIPAMANLAARTLPPSVDSAIGMQGLELLDKSLMKPTKLPAARQQVLLKRFDAMTAPLKDGHRYRLELRSAPAVGANAFALPNGIVVMTDELVALAENDDEIISVLAHEIGHVRGRHSLRMLLQSAGVAALTLALFGDVSAVSGIATSLPAMLLNAKHSRQFEREADEFSRKWLRENGIPERRFDDMLCRLEKGTPAGPDVSYLSSHPPTQERANCKRT